MANSKSTDTGLCFVTFTEHSIPITVAKQGNVLFSASLDGTVRAYDLIRYRNFTSNLLRAWATTAPTEGLLIHSLDETSDLTI